jgi:hypothetical protein
LYTLLLYKEDKKEFLESSLFYWKEVMRSEQLWLLFFDLYKSHDESRASDEIISEFRINAINHLSDIYAELHDIHKKPKYIKEFQKAFSIKSAKVEENLLEPIYHSLNNCSEKLYSIDINDKNNEFSSQEVEVHAIINTIKEELKKIKKLGLYDDSQSKILRDNVSEAIRSTAIDINNKLSEREKSLLLLNLALELSGTAGLNQKITLDVEKVSRFIEEDKNDPFKYCLFCNSTINAIDHFIFEKMHKITKVVGTTTHYVTKKVYFPRCQKCADNHANNDRIFTVAGVLVGLILGIYCSVNSELEVNAVMIVVALAGGLCGFVSYHIGERISTLDTKPKYDRYTFGNYKELIKDGWLHGEKPSK